MKVITIGGLKGGTGKTTLAAILSVSLELSGKRTAVIDLERDFRAFSRFHERRSDGGLKACDVIACDLPGGHPGQIDWYRQFKRRIDQAADDGFDCVVFDCPSDWRSDVAAAHAISHKIITTLNESPIDLYQIIRPDDTKINTSLPYSELVERVNTFAKNMRGATPDWHLSITRRCDEPTSMSKYIDQRVAAICRGGVIGEISGLVDRISYRSMLEDGLTVLDAEFKPANAATTIAARNEIQDLMRSVMDTKMPGVRSAKRRRSRKVA